MIKVMFICHGNICRSPMAEYIFKKMVRDEGIEDKFFIASAATSYEEIGNDIYPPAKRELRNRGVPFESRSARRITKEEYKDYDYIIAMDSNNIQNPKYIFDDKDKKVYKLLEFLGSSDDVADPWYYGNFDKTFDDIERGCKALLKYIRIKNIGYNEDFGQ